ncbi:hypothetical protein N9J52_03810 [Flavobacteriales bacterium]|nr:hypothetical protein [Flavobacteriales bacterium]
MLQTAVSVVLFIYFWEYSLNFQFAKWLVFELSNTSDVFRLYLELFGYNVGYFFSASKKDLATYYPRFFELIYYLGRFLKYGSFVSVILLFLLSKPIRHLRSWIVSEYSESNLSSFTAKLLPLLMLMAVSIGFYFGLRDALLNPFEFQLSLTRCFLLLTSMHLASVLVFQFPYVRKSVSEFLLAGSAPYSLAMFRILFFSFMAFMYVMSFPGWGGMFIGQMEIVPPLYTAWFWNNIPVEINLYYSVCYLNAFVALLLAFGFQTRLLLLLHAVLCFYVVTMPNVFGKIWHIQIMIWISWIMALSPCSDVLSIDALLKPVSRDKPYNFYLKIIWLHFGLIYFFAGFYKLWISGFDWALTDSMVNQLRLEWFEHYDKVPTIRIDKYPAFLMFSGLLVIVFELVFWLMIGARKLRFIAVIAGLFMHRAIEKFLYISFFSVLEVFYIVFIPWNKLFQIVGLVEKQNYSLVFPFEWKLKYVIPVLVLVCNFCFGVLNINSFPFSVYPVYASIVPDTVQYFSFVPVNEEMDVWNEGKLSGFRWENFTRDQYDVISSWESSGKLDTARVMHHWNLWKNGVSSLSDVDIVNVFLVKSPLDPSKRSNRSEQFIMTLSD